MNELRLASPEHMGLCPTRWAAVLTAAEKLCADRTLPALALQVQRNGLTTGTHCFGSTRLDHNRPVTRHTRFLVASLTKPLVAMAVLLLVERGKLALNQRVVELLPDFKEGPKRPITIRHLLSHTSGLPDMLPANEELRRQNAPLSKFVAGTCLADLVFQPGRSALYQSMGYALLGPIIEAASGQDYREFVRRELFAPLGMQDSWLGLPADQLQHPKIAEVRVPEGQQGGDDWNWNSPYWRTLGAPWGGAFSTAEDLSRFCRAMLTGGTGPHGERLFASSTLDTALSNRLHDFPDIPEPERRTRGWGLGWRLNWKDHRATFSDLLAETVVGHWGATGCLFWIDRAREIAAVLLSTQPSDRDTSPLLRLSNTIAAALR